ncbi:MAG: hypothetical protein ACYDBB_15515 [Armatimonadota bacterium]
MTRATRILAWIWIIIYCLPIITIPLAIPWMMLLMRSHLAQAIGWWIIIIGAYISQVIGISGLWKLGDQEYSGVILIGCALLGSLNMIILYKDRPKVRVMGYIERAFDEEKKLKFTEQHNFVCQAADIPLDQWQFTENGVVTTASGEHRFIIVGDESPSLADLIHSRVTLLVDDQPVAVHDPNIHDEMDSLYLEHIWKRIISAHTFHSMPLK